MDFEEIAIGVFGVCFHEPLDLQQINPLRNVGVGEFFVNEIDPVGTSLFGGIFDGRQKHENFFLHNVQLVRREIPFGFLCADVVRKNVQKFRVYDFAEHATVLL